MAQDGRYGRRGFLRKAATALGATGVVGVGAVGTAAAARTRLGIEEKSGNGTLNYIVTATDTISKAAASDEGDDDNGRKANGQVTNGGYDAWTFGSEIRTIYTYGDGYARFGMSGGFGDGNNNRVKLQGDGYYSFRVDGFINDKDKTESTDEIQGGNRGRGSVANGGNDYYDLSTAQTERFTSVFLRPHDQYLRIDKY